MSTWRKLALIVGPTLLTAVLAALGGAAAAPLYVGKDTSQAERLAMLAAGLAAAIMIWSGWFVHLRRRYLWLARHPAEEAPALRFGQWLEVVLGALASALVTGLLALAALLLRHGLQPGDPYLGAPVVIAAVAGCGSWLWLRDSCRQHNRPPGDAGSDSGVSAGSESSRASAQSPAPG